jgi:hypothetical protein
MALMETPPADQSGFRQQFTALVGKRAFGDDGTGDVPSTAAVEEWVNDALARIPGAAPELLDTMRVPTWAAN